MLIGFRICFYVKIFGYVSAKELFLACNQYAVMWWDSYIPSRKSKYGIGWICQIINVSSERKRLVNDLLYCLDVVLDSIANIVDSKRPNGLKATNEFELMVGLLWVEVEGVPFMLWTINTFTRIAESGKLIDVDDQMRLVYSKDFVANELMVGGFGSRNSQYEYESGDDTPWMRRSATKYEQLDRFLVSESVISGSPNIKAVTLERFLSDHRPILLKENGYDYGPTPFRFLPSFVEMIRIWNKSNSGTRKNDQLRLKKQLEEIDLDIDRGLGNEELGDVCEAGEQVGFGDKWRKWIQCSVLHSSKGYIIINGSPTDEFQFGRGLKQGFIQFSESLRSKFFNGHESSGKKASWVQWKKALAPKDNGGLVLLIHGLGFDTILVVYNVAFVKEHDRFAITSKGDLKALFDSICSQQSEHLRLKVRMKTLLEQQGLAARGVTCSHDYHQGDDCNGDLEKLETLYMTKSLANRLYLKKNLYTFQMHPGKSQSEHIDEFHKLVGDLAAIDTAISDEDRALLLLTSLPSSYDYFVETLLYGRDTLKLEDVLAILNFRELQKMTEAKGDGGEGLYSEEHLKRDCPRYNHKKSQGFVMNEDQVPASGAEGYDSVDVMMAMSVEELLDWIMDSGGSYHITYMRDYLVDFEEYDGDNILLGDGRECRVCGTSKVQVHMRDGSSFVLDNVRSPSSAIGFKTPIDKLGFFGWLASKRQGMLESVKVKCIFLGYRKGVVGNKALEVLQGVEFEGKPQEDHIFEVEPHGNVDHVAGSQEAGLKDDMEARSDVYVLNNGCRKCSEDNDIYYWEYTPGLLVKAKGNVLGMEIVRDQSGNTLRVSQSRFYNGKLVHTLLEGHSILSLEGSLSGDRDVKKNGKWSCIYAVGSQEYQMVCTRLNIASADVAMRLHMMALSTTEEAYMALTETAKEAIWLKRLAIESGFELKIVAGIATRALSKAVPGSRLQLQ
ncbi:hypothetical protein Tco_1124677 [Tanacetum coccineum]|uniref:Retrovirus-related Pol polyprotein from transposon TNT 1-94-like beta-barrel domain-containing protein n=1 Tax=Tanacetum coccineum TaxID=301880 RepID=A0ABQ5J6T6_9ASTR